MIKNFLTIFLILCPVDFIPLHRSTFEKTCTAESLGFLRGSAGKESACSVGDLGSIPGLGRYPGEGNSYPLQYSGLENSVDRIVYGVAQVGHDRVTFIFFFTFTESLTVLDLFPDVKLKYLL